MASGTDPRAWFEAKVRQLTSESFNALEDAMEAGENITKHNIETRGTIKSGKRGRVETGEMRDSVQSDTVKQGPDVMIGRFGWLEKKPFYAEFQEDGTKYIEPMYALSDAAEEVKIDYLEKMEGIVRDA